ncbi:MAG: GNAT family N-acetyltransferase [Caldilineaceae bacterium]|nr:GNAT family N-acetyltransferase [Caldilineaceae bacterium]
MSSTDPQSQRLKFVVNEAEDAEVHDFLAQQIREHNNQVSAHHRRVRVDGLNPFQIVVRDDEGEIVAGVAASTYWQWLEVDKLWVDESLRGRGVGRQLLRRAEEIAIERGCLRAMLTTYSFQARGFYEKEGYRIVGALEDYPPGSTFYWLRKDFGDDRVTG